MIEPPSDTLAPLERLRQVVHLLRGPGGCPWDREQTHESLVPNLLEEAYEAAEAIRSGDREHMAEELGDLLLQAVMHGEIGVGEGTFDLDTIATGITEKLVRRHPHVFAGGAAADTRAVLKQWDEIKLAEKGDRGTTYLGAVTVGLPSLMRATKIQKKVAKIGFDWPDTTGVLAKIREELDEVEAALEESDERSAEEIGDLLFAVVNLARKKGFDAENLLAATNEKFIDRFHKMEAGLSGDGKTLEAATLDEMEEAWQSSK